MPKRQMSAPGRQGGMVMEDVQVLVSGILTKKDRKFARISFMRGEEYAEFIVPDGGMDRHRGFTEEEITKLYRYVRENRDHIMKEAKGVNVMRNWLNLGKK